MTSALLIEDDERVRSFLVRGLKTEGYHVDVAGDGATGLQLAQHQRYDVMILDIMLPDLDGRDVCRRLRNHGVRVPILLLTALDAVEDKVSGLRGGADDYLTKPFDFDELLARLDALVRRVSGIERAENTLLQAGDVTLDQQALTVKRSGKPVDLTAKEFQLLEMLLSSPGKVLSRSRILNKIWSYDTDPMTNVIDVYIRRLRTKLQWDADSGPLRTMRGYGYKIEPDSEP